AGRAGGPVGDAARHLLLLARDGSRRPVSQSSAAIHDDNGDFVGVVVVFRDVSERRRMERELKRRAAGLGDRGRRQGGLLPMLAPELRNPRAPLRNALQVLRTESDTAAALAEMAPIMERQLGNLIRLVDDLMDVSRITRGKIELRKEPVELGAAVTRTV